MARILIADDASFMRSSLKYIAETVGHTVVGMAKNGAEALEMYKKLKPEVVEGSVGVLNSEMLRRAGRRTEFRELWRIGRPYRPEPIRAVEVQGLGADIGFPPFARCNEPWTKQSLALAVGHAVLGALGEAHLIGGDPQVHAGDRAGGYVRVFIETANQQDGALFARSLREALGPLQRPRYVIPRYVHDINETWLSRVLPEIVARYFRQRRRRMTMLHAVPSALAKHRKLAAIYTRHWNAHVSPGQAVYARSDEGERLVEQCQRDGTAPQHTIHDKEIFL